MIKQNVKMIKQYVQMIKKHVRCPECKFKHVILMNNTDSNKPVNTNHNGYCLYQSIYWNNSVFCPVCHFTYMINHQSTCTII